MVIPGNRMWARCWVRRGVAAVELAVILPALVTIVLGCVDFGRFAYSYIAVTNATRVGADFASTNRYTTTTQSTWNTQVKEAVQDEMSQMPGFDATKLSVPAPVLTIEQPGGLRRVSVQASYPFKTIVSWPLLPNQMTLSRTVVMRCIRW